MSGSFLVKKGVKGHYSPMTSITCYAFPGTLQSFMKDKICLFSRKKVPMQITRQADYAVRAVLHLARMQDGAKTATSSVAKEQHIPPSFLAKIVSQLSVAGLLHTSRGARGGVTLARDPKHITLLEVVEAIDGPIQLNECVTESGVCSFSENCPVRSVWCQAQEELIARLGRTDFAQLLAQAA
jgi:Rrf2 family protein